MKHLPNIITLLRFAGAFSLLLCDVTGVVFWVIPLFQSSSLLLWRPLPPYRKGIS